MSSSREMWRFGSGEVAHMTSAVLTSSSRSGRSGSQAGLRTGKRDVTSRDHFARHGLIVRALEQNRTCARTDPLVTQVHSKIELSRVEVTVSDRTH